MKVVNHRRDGGRGGWTRGLQGLIARLSIRGRLLLLLVLPLGAAVLAAGPFVAVQAFGAAAAGRTADAAADARSVAVLMGELQTERLLTSAFLASPGADAAASLRQQRTVDETVELVRTQLGSTISDELASALVRVGSLKEVRDIAAVRGVPPDRVARSYHATIEALTDALRLVSRQDSDDGRGARQLTALDALLRADEFAELRDVALVAVAVDPDSGRPLLDDSEAQAALFVERFVQQADTDLAGIVVGAREGESAREAEALVTRLPDPGDPVAVRDFAGSAVGVVGQLADARQGARERVTALIADSALARATGAGVTAWAVGLGTASLMLLVAGLSVLVGRSIATPLRRLTAGAREVTNLVTGLAEEERADVWEGERRSVTRLPQPADIEIVSDDELGRLTAAFNQMRATAVELIERQIVTRQNVGLMFANVAQRTRNLVGRQLSLIDELERNEQDPHLLSNLYRLDHLTTRLRRNADNLLVVAGARDEIGVSGPTALSTAMRAALAQIEDYQRVRIVDPPDLRFGAPLGADLILLFAELLENATSFSPPTAVVEVGVALGGDGSCEVTIVDHGMGMPADRLAAENRRLVERERLDVAPTTVLGLLVVGRISRRHGLTVELVRTTEGGGVTARVLLPGRLFHQPVETVPPAGGAAANGHQDAGTTAIPAVLIPPAGDSGLFLWFADVVTGHHPHAAAGGFGPRPGRQPGAVARNGVPPAPAGPVVTGDGHGTRNGLRRRVAGAQLPAAGRSPAPPRTDTAPRRRPHHDAAAARDDFGAFEAGFARAADGVPPTGPPGAPLDGAMAALHGPVAQVPVAQVPVAQVPVAQGLVPPGRGASGEPPAGAQRSGLTRRVPGANMAPGLRSRRAARTAAVAPGQPPRDPVGERTRFDAFQDAVSRAAQQDSIEETRA